MRTSSNTPCRRLQPLLASYADGQASSEEAAAIDAHVGACETCRRWLSGQRAVRGLLRTRAASLRAQGVATPVAPVAAVARLAPSAASPAGATPSRYPSRAAVVVVAVAATLVAAAGIAWRAWPASGPSLMAVGFINDSRCKTVRTDDPACVRLCVDEHQAEYVFVSNGVVYPIVNQGFDGLAAFAAREVRLAGSLDGPRVTVTRIDLAD
jgi:anti-sigma factor ChrR (cupin superfamily)